MFLKNVTKIIMRKRIYRYNEYEWTSEEYWSTFDWYNEHLVLHIETNKISGELIFIDALTSPPFINLHVPRVACTQEGQREGSVGCFLNTFLGNYGWK